MESFVVYETLQAKISHLIVEKFSNLSELMGYKGLMCLFKIWPKDSKGNDEITGVSKF